VVYQRPATTGVVPDSWHTADVLTLADDQISFDHALAHLARYAQAVPDTIRYYDYAGDLDDLPAPSNGVEVADIARLVVINAQLRANDVRALLAPVDPDLWARVPMDFRFEELPLNPLGHPVYQALVALYDAYKARAGLDKAKITKLLHLKRPHLVPVLDSVAERAYEARAVALAKELGQGKALYWAAMWNDARQNAAETAALKARLAEDRSTWALAALSPLRLQDILVWSHFESRDGCAEPR
jgi:hypothetical protein